MKVERQFLIPKSHEVDPDINQGYWSYILATRLEYVEWHLGMCPKWSTICREEERNKLWIGDFDQDRNQDRKQR